MKVQKDMVLILADLDEKEEPEKLKHGGLVTKGKGKSMKKSTIIRGPCS